MKKVYMAIGGHIGDAELTSGCVLATKALEGHKIITVALTGGERGNPAGISVEDYRKQKIKEANQFAEMLNGEAIVLDYADGELPDNKEVRLEVANLIRKYRPNAIFTHWPNSMHIDHHRTSLIVQDASFFAGIDMGDLVAGDRHYSPVYFAENWEDADGFNPYIYIPCSVEGYELWKEAISKHWFIMNSKSFRYFDYYTHLTYVRGALARTTHAQAFAVFDYQKKVIRNDI